jgi:hypothetical protein
MISMKKQVMIAAWKIARMAVAKFGGKVSEYLSEALRMAWKNVKAAKSVVTVELRQPNRKQKTWVAEIVGTHPVYKFERKFVNPVSFGETVWELAEGIYEVCENGRRYFIQVANGDYRAIDVKDVAAAVA